MNRKNVGKTKPINYKLVGGITFLIFFIDILIKQLVQINNISTNNGIFDITYITNKGTMWSLFSNGNYGNVIFIILSFAALGFLYYYLKTENQYHVPVSIIAGGILGNLFDRIIYGHVIDWANLHWWPVFNIADAAIVCGVIWLASSIIKEEISSKKKVIIKN